MTARRGGRPLVPAYLSTGGQTRPSTGNLERLSILTGLVVPGPAPVPPGAPVGTGASGGSPDGVPLPPPPPSPGPDGSVPPGTVGGIPAQPGPGARTAGSPAAAGGPTRTTATAAAPGDPFRTGPGDAPGAVPPLGPPPDLPAAQLALLDVLDGGSLTVVETAALLELPVSAVRVLAAHLIDRGLVRARPPIPDAVPPAPDLLERVADGLRALKL